MHIYFSWSVSTRSRLLVEELSHKSFSLQFLLLSIFPPRGRNRNYSFLNYGQDLGPCEFNWRKRLNGSGSWIPGEDAFKFSLRF